MAGRPIRTFTVLPQLPDRLQPLHKLAYNLWWCWNPDAVALFRRIDAGPVRGARPQPDPAARRHRPGPLRGTARTTTASSPTWTASRRRSTRYLTAPTWFQDHVRRPRPDARIAYFSAEFGIHESVPVYSGGLGVLAGDHLKTRQRPRPAARRRRPDVPRGLLPPVPERRRLAAGALPGERLLQPAADPRDSTPDGTPLLVSVPLPGREVSLRIWRIQVGRVPLYLLDTNIPQNRAEDRGITAQLYGGDHDMRIRQEIVLGIGGIRALQALGKMPTVCHMNEGHSAFCGLERIRVLMEEHKLDFATAREAVKAGTCFTTHTPVPGRQRRLPAAADRAVPRRLHAAAEHRPATRSSAWAGRTRDNEQRAVRHDRAGPPPVERHQRRQQAARQRVAEDVARTSGPSCPTAEVPITSITNGVHTQSWLSPEIGAALRPLPRHQWEEQADRLRHLEARRAHPRRRAVADARAPPRAAGRLRPQPAQGAARAPRRRRRAEIAAAEEVLDPEALTIGFARRFATYKRGDADLPQPRAARRAS